VKGLLELFEETRQRERENQYATDLSEAKAFLQKAKTQGVEITEMYLEETVMNFCEDPDLYGRMKKDLENV
jgi:hypothetical protein